MFIFSEFSSGLHSGQFGVRGHGKSLVFQGFEMDGWDTNEIVIWKYPRCA